MNNTLDVVFSFSFDIDSYEAVEYESIEKRKASLIMSKEHPLADTINLTISDIQNESFICYDPNESSGASELSLSTCQMMGYEPNRLIC